MAAPYSRALSAFKSHKRCLQLFSMRQVTVCTRALSTPATWTYVSAHNVTAGKPFHMANFWSHRHLHTTRLRPAGKVVPFILSDIGEGIRDVIVKEWFIKEGDTVAQFDSLCEVQSDKASVTITSRYDGVIKTVHYGVDDMAFVGKPLVDIIVAQESDEVVSGLSDDEIDASSSDEEPESSSSENSPASEGGESHYDTVKGQKVLAAPAVRRIAKENKISLTNVLGTGKHGRITKEDVLLYLNAQKSSQVSPATTAVSPPTPKRSDPAPTPPAAVHRQPAGEDRKVALRGIRKAMVKAMTEALKIPHFGYCDEVDMGSLVQLRGQLKGSPLLPQGVPFSYMPVIIKATSMALTEYPFLNASLDEDETHLIYKAAHNIGFAMDTQEGLLVPNIKDVGHRSIAEVAMELTRLMDLGQAGKLGADDITGGTFSLSNIGSIGGTYAKPVILPPEIAIGALGKIQQLPRFDEEGQVVRAHIMQVSWSADHRAVEGAQMARFSNLWKSYLENPSWMLLNLK